MQKIWNLANKQIYHANQLLCLNSITIKINLTNYNEPIAKERQNH